MHRLLVFMLPLILLAGCTVNPQDTGMHNPGNAPGNATRSPVFTMQEVAKHDTKADCWMVINGDVLNLTGFPHPGGDTYVPYCGTDGTAAFNSQGGRGINHTPQAFAMLNNYKIGVLAGGN